MFYLRSGYGKHAIRTLLFLPQIPVNGRDDLIIYIIINVNDYIMIDMYQLQNGETTSMENVCTKYLV